MEKPGPTDIETLIGELKNDTEDSLDIVFHLLQEGSFSYNEIVTALVVYKVVKDEDEARELMEFAKDLLALEDDVNEAAFSLDAEELEREKGGRVVTRVFVDDQGNTAISFGVDSEDILE